MTAKVTWTNSPLRQTLLMPTQAWHDRDADSPADGSFAHYCNIRHLVLLPLRQTLVRVLSQMCKSRMQSSSVPRSPNDANTQAKYHRGDGTIEQTSLPGAAVLRSTASISPPRSKRARHPIEARRGGMPSRQLPRRRGLHVYCLSVLRSRA